MSHKVLALKYRPKEFGDLRGQEAVAEGLRESIKAGRIANAYLFSGPRGVGKTSAARILARALNCLSAERPVPEPCNRCESCLEILSGRSMDLIEIDGASNRGIDEVRGINENTRFLPARSRFKIYLVDEVHMLTEPAFNALLKTLEEPPAHVKFIFATTHPGKLLPTVISRCERYDFHLVPADVIYRHLEDIAAREGIRAEPAALTRVSRAAAGSFRDGMSLLDQVSSLGSGGMVTAGDTDRILGLIPESAGVEMLEALLDGRRRECFELLDRVTESGHEIYRFFSGLLEFIRYLVLLHYGAGEPVSRALTPETADRLRGLSDRLTASAAVALFERVAEEREKMRYDDLVRLRVEVALLKLMQEFAAPRAGAIREGVGEPVPVPDRAAPGAVPPRPGKLSDPAAVSGPPPGAPGGEKPPPPAPADAGRGSGPPVPEQEPPPGAGPFDPGDEAAIADAWKRFAGFIEEKEHFQLATALKDSRIVRIGRRAGVRQIEVGTDNKFYFDWIKSNQEMLSRLWLELFDSRARLAPVMRPPVQRPAAGAPAADPAAVPAPASPGPPAPPAPRRRTPQRPRPELKPEEEKAVALVVNLFAARVVAGHPGENGGTDGKPDGVTEGTESS